ncbi:4Fe-4S dicluster domain-containing protein [Clostridium kluyveri]|uniref:RnfC related NADH dehydrogenase n=3 Tax=Clostridium kluyveri TaxID=1534 RepID=A5N6H0_CLOK5|nr:4Fe-4S dicluster domain-containing protein [Clostridium kluyveri]EDK32901.1 RnfC related NADH dehydrogenase [Clostridium kluyveri DSM 555]EDK32905.1 RnfC related NADH dehydrogenase [Clostridium kluyveri DSM 555]BAH05814.1 hypothetical protein CKR_0763 [Clostridium kluyveri NBRC 12016]
MDLLKKIKDAGIIGAGGAGFPTHVKLNTKVEYFIVNGLECEPLLQSDKYLMRNYSDEIVETVQKIGEAIGAAHAVIGLKAAYHTEIEALKKSINKLNSTVELFLSEAFYPAGDEQVLVYEVTGRTIPPGGIPSSVGAVVSNVGTVVNIADAINDKPVTYKYVTVIGEVGNPSIIKVPIGTKVMECIDKCGGTTVDDYTVIMGGPMMGKKLSKEEAEDTVITKTNGGIIVIPRNHLIQQKESISIDHMINKAKSSCIQCHYCTDMCPRFLIGHPLHPHKVMRGIALAEGNEALKEAIICCQCGVCEMFACPMGLSPRRMNAYVKAQMMAKGIKWKNETDQFEGRIMREEKRIPTGRLIARLKMSKYKGQSIKEGEELVPGQVSIPLKQGLGAPSTAIVSVGDVVEVGQMVGAIDEGKMGTNVHASIKGEVVEVNENVVIKAI